MTTYAEPIPEYCPPGDAVQPQGMDVFRLVETVPPTEVDFQSHSVRWPETFGSRFDCDAWSLSVFTTRENLNRILGMKVHRNKQIARLRLLPESGKVKQSGGDQAHYSWWRFNGFDPIGICEVVE